MTAHPSSSDAPIWRRANQTPSAPKSVPTPASRDHQAHRKEKESEKDNWRAHAHPVSDPSKPHQDPSRSQPMTIGSPSTQCASASRSNGHAFKADPLLLSSSLKCNNARVIDADWVSGNHPHADPHASLSIKPSSMGNGIIGRSPEFGTSPTKSKAAPSSAVRHHWPLSSSLEKDHATGPATHLQPLRIEHLAGSRLFPTTSTPVKTIHTTTQHHPIQSTLQDSDRNDNWMLTPTSSLPSIPGTPNRVREASTERLLSPRNHADSPYTASSRPTPSIRSPVEHFQASISTAPRTPSPAHGFSRQEGGFSGSSLFNRGPSVNILSSPKRSPLVVSNLPHRQPAATLTDNTVLLSPTTSPKLSQRTLSPVTRHPPAMADANANRVVNSIASMLNGSALQPRPGPASRRESFNSIASTGAGHTMSHSRRSSAVFSPNSPTVSSRIGVYRPPHLRNRGSVSGLKPSVAHYDRVRTPSLRGLSRSRESSISLSRPTSRPPSTVPFYHADTIPEDGQVDDASRTPLRGRQSTMSIHLPDLIAEQQQRNASATSATPAAEDGGVSSFAPNTNYLLEQPLDSASLLAKLRAQLVRREAAASDASPSDMDRNSVITEDNEQDFLDLSEMMEYGASEGHPLSRYGSTNAIEGRPLGDVFGIGDLLGPGMEHEGHVIKIAETTPGFVDQNEDLTGSKLEVVRKLGEGSYAVVYLVKEVSAEEAAAHTSQNSVAIPKSVSKSNFSEAGGRNSDDDADLTMVASSEDLLSTTLKANGKGKEDGFHNSPALEERRRKNLKINTGLRPGKEFALKCLCKRDLPEDMLEVQRLEATIHQSIPAHPNIVTLYRTYETPDWLFLVLEYCPGQDLYYWLEQAQDEGHHSDTVEEDRDQADSGKDHIGSLHKLDGSGSDSEKYEVLGSSLDGTPPSPSLLASTSGQGLLSKRRIRLIARMFRQICDAVQFCHDRGVSHRDIKPENFIVEDRRTVEEMQSACPDTSASTLVDSIRDGDDTRVIVKMTDFGLATAEDRCDDFDCGSKPYMAFECHNNISTSYDPKQADIWSLGIVLLNLLFHRSPFTEPSMECPSFAAYCEDPIRFLMESFDGLTMTVARFLTENVFCSISDEPDASQKRISAGEFSRWACGLVDHMGLSGPGRGRMSRGASIYSTVPLMHSRTGSMSTLPSLLSSPRPRARSLIRDTDHIPDLDVTADATFRAALASARQDSLSPHHALFTPDVLPSPTFTPLSRPSERNPFDTQYGVMTDSGLANETIVEGAEFQKSDLTEPHRSSAQLSTGLAQAATSDEAENDREMKRLQDTSSAPKIRDSAVPDDTHQSARADSVVPSANGTLPTVDAAEGNLEHLDTSGGADVDKADADGDDQDGTEDGDGAESVATSNHSKRRKRGARKGRTLAKHLKRSQSVEAMAGADDPEARARERERTIRELALASENLARQMSKMVKPAEGTDSALSPKIVLSKPTAEAAARYSLQTKTVADGETAQPVSSGLAAARSLKPAEDAANWSSAALRRERMSEQRKTGASVLEDSGRSRVMSWRERNQSVATISSAASVVTTASSQSSTSSATSSIYSTASAPAAMLRKDFASRNRTRGSGFGLDTISERERAPTVKKEVDAKYLAGIFGGDGSAEDKKRRESTAVRSGEQRRAVSSSAVQSAVSQVSPTDKADKSSKLFGLLSDGGGKVDGTSSSAISIPSTVELSQRANGDAAMNGSSQRSVSLGSTTSNPSNPGMAASFVSRFRRPGSSSSSTNKVATSPEADTAADKMSAPQLGASLGMRRDASTSTSSLHRTKDEQAAEVAPTKSNGSGGSASNKAPSEAGTDAPKKRGMGKFLSGVRDSIKNL